MEFEFMTADTVLPPCMPLPTAILRLPVSSTAKVMYARLLDATFAASTEDTNGILFVRFPIVELAAALSRSSVTVKRSLKERIGGRWTNPAGAPGRGRTEPHLHAAPQEGGLL